MDRIKKIFEGVGVAVSPVYPYSHTQLSEDELKTAEGGKLSDYFRSWNGLQSLRGPSTGHMIPVLALKATWHLALTWATWHWLILATRGGNCFISRFEDFSRNSSQL